MGFLCNVIYFNFPPFDFFSFLDFLFFTYFRFFKNIVLRRCPQFHQTAKETKKVKQPWPWWNHGEKTGPVKAESSDKPPCTQDQALEAVKAESSSKPPWAQTQALDSQVN